MSFLSPLISHSAPKTRKTNNPDNKKQTPKPNQTAKNLYKPPYVSDWSYTIHIHALNN